jgi:hypothetical protein
VRRTAFTLALAAAVLWLIAPAALAQADDQNCGDFASQAEAQDHLRADPSDPDGLDGQPGPGNGDGIACEDLPAPFDHIPVVLSFTGAATLPKVGAAAALLVVGGLLLRGTRYRPHH